MNKKYYQSIDKLYKQVQNNRPIELNDACWIIWAELGVCSHVYLQFKEWIIKNKEDKPKTWQIWKFLYNGFNKEIYDRNLPYSNL